MARPWQPPSMGAAPALLSRARRRAHAGERGDGALVGIDAVVVEVEVDMALGLPYFNVVGLPEGR